jgi:hypothetical protein
VSNETYSKENVLLEAVRTLLVNDNSNTSKIVREIHFYCGDRIERDFVAARTVFPKITLSVDHAAVHSGLPSGTYFLDVTGHYEIGEQNSLTKLSRMMARSNFLLNEKHDNLNVAVSGKNLRCRQILMLSSIGRKDEFLKHYLRTLRFSVVCDDEILD